MTKITPAKAVLVDARNIDELAPRIISEIANAPANGIDLETHDLYAHEGIKALRKEDDEGNKAGGGKFVFDWHRMVVTGLSIYPDGSENSYYFNLNQADVENRIPWPRVKEILDSKPKSTIWVSHNGPFEITVLANTYGYLLEDVICTLQMAVSAYGPDEYDRSFYVPLNFGQMVTLFPDAEKLFSDEGQAIENQLEAELEVDEEEVQTKRLNSKQNELLIKVIGKASTSSFSYNGVIGEIAYSYGLKKMVKMFFDYQMATFEQTLGNARHMGELTGPQVADYGCDDAFWAVKVFYWLVNYMTANCPEAIDTFFKQENPMIYVYSDIRCEGMRVDKGAIERRREHERKLYAQTLRDLKAAARSLLPFRHELDKRLCMDSWYSKVKKDGSIAGYEVRNRFVEFVNSPDEDDDFKQVCQVSSPVSNAWAGKKINSLSIGHYYQTRLMMYDLCQLNTVVYKGKIQSDAETRGELRDRIRREIETAKTVIEHIGDANDPVSQENAMLIERHKNADKLLKLMGDIASIEQRMKLYITPYLLLTDPETSRMYPEVSSMLATRRMASSNPNPMQLAKRGESTYIRGFYVPDEDDHVLISLDWSQIELVLIGEFSGDPEFARAYGQLPYNDLHLGTAADVLSVMVPEVTEQMLKDLHKIDLADIPPKLLIKPNGEPLTQDKAKSFWRTEVGKGSNFNYWYSGALSTVGEKLGWSPNQMWEATERYRERFPHAEKWRVDTIDYARWNGYIMLPDGHRRVRWEATYDWANLSQRMFDAFESRAISRFGSEIIRATKTRAGNQIVNAMIQGSSATLAKRSILELRKRIKEEGIRAWFKMPIHDELLFSVHRDDAIRFIALARSIMTKHPDIIKSLKVHATASLGLTFEPFNAEKAPLGQVELDEAPSGLSFVDKDSVMNDNQILQTIDYLFDKRAAA